ncbi:MAG: PAS domain S-box protein [Planctomycetes bacterium]|nr:PAS domain S-box protein [Planctomycetota bacterium]
MKQINWSDEFPGAITVCDAKGIILYMNQKAGEVFKKYGGLKLIGQSVLDCHPGPARTKLRKMLKSHKPNTYTIEKKGRNERHKGAMALRRQKIIFQTPWYLKGRYKGFVELSLEIPFKMPHFVRK